ncbi:hypothetical protein [uncultured Mediterranean phage uvMED]|nr:hypothetical protein [uncultured Mediterranean phage uvMED]
MSRTQAKRQFENEVKANLNRWFEESDLDVEELAESALKAIDDWLDEEVVDFTPDE